MEGLVVFASSGSISLSVIYSSVKASLLKNVPNPDLSLAELQSSNGHLSGL